MTVRHISVDCETLSLHENPALLSIGAVVFDPYRINTAVQLRRGWPTFFSVIDLKDQVERFGRHLDAETIMWWLRQPDSTRAHVVSDSPNYLSGVMGQFSNWIVECAGNDAMLWSHGAAEDAVWLRSAYRATTCGGKFPINYRNIRDTRTLFDIANTPEIEVPGLTKHVALDDAIYQALRIQHAYKQLSKTKEQA